MDHDTARKAATAPSTAGERSTASAAMREKARDLRIRASAILDPANRRPMLSSAVEFERRARQLDRDADAAMTARR